MLFFANASCYLLGRLAPDVGEAGTNPDLGCQPWELSVPVTRHFVTYEHVRLPGG